MERSVFLFEPKDKAWGVSNADQIQLAPGQTYVAALLHRPPNYWLNRLLRPISSTVSVEPWLWSWRLLVISESVSEWPA